MESVQAFHIMASRTMSRHLQSLSPERMNRKRHELDYSTENREDSTHIEGGNIFPSRRSSKDEPKFSTELQQVTPFKELQPVCSPSPSFGVIQSFRRHSRTNSDVQGLVKRFEHLDVRDRDAESQDRKRKHDAELKRAQIAREEAESDVKRLRAELRAVRKEADDARERERKIGKRLEVVTEEYAGAKEAHAVGSSIYQKELRKIRKEAFKSSSAILKLQEELKSARTSLQYTQSAFDIERQKMERGTQEAYNLQSRLLSMHEDLEKTKHELEIVTKEKAALIIAMKQEEVTHIASQGLIALPVGKDDEFDSNLLPQSTERLNKILLAASDVPKNNQASPKKHHTFRIPSADLVREKARRENAESMVEFLTLECRFNCCSCVNAPRWAGNHVLAESLPEHFGMLISDAKQHIHPSTDSQINELDIDSGAGVRTGDTLHNLRQQDQHGSMNQSPMTMDEPVTSGCTLAQENPLLSLSSSPEMEDVHMHQPTQQFVESETRQDVSINTIPVHSRHDRPSSPGTPLHSGVHRESGRQPSVRTVTTTTTIPMHFTPVSKSTVPERCVPDRESTYSGDACSEPLVIDRAAALAAIQYRRGRAKSIANGHITPRKQMLEGTSLKERRDISAPTLGSKSMASFTANIAVSASKISKRLS